jgi:type IV pilus assembly protein PilC
LLFFLSDLLAAYWFAFLLAPALLIGIGLLLLRHNPLARRHLDDLKLRLPMIGPVLSKIILSRFANTLAMLYAAGIPILESIRSTQLIVGNRAHQQALQQVEQTIQAGHGITDAFQAAEIFPPLVIRMLRTGESTGKLDKALRNVSYFYNRDVKDAVAKAQAMIEPMLTVVMGLLLGWIMLSVIAPIYDVIARIKL